ncbi:myosin heavy chain, non-muscle-like [Rhinatrema bivittatum]|uniref:myosin heavy chain, non-muscle-like n=1 Tax=Rhinatrema bivittatum TaxID=194408 RepID=UPI00112AB311|nr:myosin heavy chain, non-muscle-like [Rhinatrema bivittatum]
MVREEHMEEEKGSLSKEKSKRISLQAKKAEIEKQAEFWASAEEKIQNEMNLKIENGKRRHEELTNECTSIQRDFVEFDANIAILRKELNKAEDEYEYFELILKREARQLEDKLKMLNQNLEIDEEHLEEKNYELKNAERRHEEEVKKFEEMKMEMRSMCLMSQISNKAS